MPIRSVLLIALLIANPVWAQGPDVEIPQTLEQAADQRARAKQLVAESDARYAAEQQACYSKFLVNSCLDEARKRHTQALIDARNLDIPARDFQREAKRADVEAKEAQRAADRPLREAEQQAQGESYRAEEAAKAAEREKKIAAKAQKAAEGRQKTAAEQARRQAKQEQRAKDDAARAAKKADEAARKAAKDAASTAAMPK